MSEKIRKVGSWTILIGVFATILSTIFLNTSSWAVTQLTAVEPIKKTMTTILDEGRTNQKEALEYRAQVNDQFAALATLIHEQNVIISDNRVMVLNLEKRCDQNRQDIINCQNRHYSPFRRTKD